MDITKLNGKIPYSVLSQVPDVMTKFMINTSLRLAHFLAQCSHESANFSATMENLNYSATGLMKTFSRYFPTIEKANEYARQPEKIANYVYGNRMGNGPETSGDGYRYRGRGYIQLTGKNNYKMFSVVAPEILSEPDLVATKYPLLSAAWFWGARKLNLFADYNDIEAITKFVNGGENGLDDRKAKFKLYYSCLSSPDSSSNPTPPAAPLPTPSPSKSPSISDIFAASDSLLGAFTKKS